MDNKSEELLNKVLNEKPYKLVFSNPKSKTNKYKKVNLVSKLSEYQAECFTDKQVFHRNLQIDEVPGFASELLTKQFSQLNAWTESKEYQLKFTKKGEPSLLGRRIKSGEAPKVQTSHNKEKKYLLLEGENIPPLVDMGIFTKDGKIVNSMYDKYKQINRFLEIVDDALKQYAYKDDKPLKVIDFGCGKSYLTFVLYYFLTEIKGFKVKMIGLDLKEDVIAKCNKSAEKYGYSDLSFTVGDIGCYEDSEPADMVVTLHACDTATDYALMHAIEWGAKMIFSVPCCQHELNGQMKTDDLAIISRYGIVKDRACALFTDSIRANLLECCGYKTNLMEFVDFENTPKNLLIRAVKEGSCIPKISAVKRDESKIRYYREVINLMDEFHLNPCLYRLLDEKGYLNTYKDDQI